MEALDTPVGEQNGRERDLRGVFFFRGRAFADSLQTSCTLAPQVGSKPASLAAPVVHPQATQL